MAVQPMWAMQQLQPHLTDGLAAMRSAQWCLIGKCGLAINAQQHLQPISKAGHGPGSTGRRDAGCPNAVCLDAVCRAGQDGAWLQMGDWLYEVNLGDIPQRMPDCGFQRSESHSAAGRELGDLS